MPLPLRNAAYLPLDTLHIGKDLITPNPRKPNQKRHYLILGFCVFFLSVIGITRVALYPKTSSPQLHFRKPCEYPPTRREWRSLSQKEKQDYIEAIQCLKTLPSQVGMNQSLYNDFPWVHTMVAHDAAAFLSWHRYFLHAYERALKEQCSYTGHLTYWDWTLDWEDITKSPIWDDESGFGGDGNSSVGDAIWDGHCVTQGPFAHLEVLHLADKNNTHCLSRGFEQGENLRHLREGIQPAAVERLLFQEDYETFNLGLENGPHLKIPMSIRGDFALFSAPNDPVFFLHHTQLDRLWWIWQHVDIQNRQKKYTGKAAYNSTKEASLTDVIPMGGLLPDIRVADIMSTETELLCYRY